jgi:sugar/nucleoside kinase (ribokinase family)
MGGAPPNVLAGLARLGAKFPLSGAGIIGYDAAGDWILDQCAKLGIDTRLIARTEEGPTSYTDVMNVERTGRRTFFHQPGVNALLGPESIDLAASSAKLFHLGYLLLLDRLDQPGKNKDTAAAELLDQALHLGFITSVDVVSEESDRYPSIVLPALPCVDLVFLNEFEAGHVFSTEIRVDGQIDIKALLKTAQALVAAGVRRWVIVSRKACWRSRIRIKPSFNRACDCRERGSLDQPERATLSQPESFLVFTTISRWNVV